MNGTSVVGTNLALDFDGNLGIRGVYRSVSTRKAKWAIEPYRGNALDLLNEVPLSTFHYRGESASEPLHIGFLAENTPTELSGIHHDSFNLNNSIGVTIAATKQMDRRVDVLTLRVAQLERLVRALRSERSRH